MILQFLWKSSNHISQTNFQQYLLSPTFTVQKCYYKTHQPRIYTTALWWCMALRTHAQPWVCSFLNSVPHFSSLRSSWYPLLGFCDFSGMLHNMAVLLWIWSGNCNREFLWTSALHLNMSYTISRTCSSQSRRYQSKELEAGNELTLYLEKQFVV